MVQEYNTYMHMTLINVTHFYHLHNRDCFIKQHFPVHELNNPFGDSHRQNRLGPGG